MSVAVGARDPTCGRHRVQLVLGRPWRHWHPHPPIVAERLRSSLIGALILVEREKRQISRKFSSKFWNANRRVRFREVQDFLQVEDQILPILLESQTCTSKKQTKTGSREKAEVESLTM